MLGGCRRMSTKPKPEANRGQQEDSIFRCPAFCSRRESALIPDTSGVAGIVCPFVSRPPRSRAASCTFHPAPLASCQVKSVDLQAARIPVKGAALPRLLQRERRPLTARKAAYAGEREKRAKDVIRHTGLEGSFTQALSLNLHSRFAHR